jgi:branched-chain amino acid transport system ATP-binding protein
VGGAGEAGATCALPGAGRPRGRPGLGAWMMSSIGVSALAMAGGEQTVLELRGVKRHFGGIRAVDGVTLTIPEGSVTALIGPNGAGKSTLFALMMGEIPLTEGKILLDGRDMRGMSTERRVRMGVGRTFQTPRLFAGLSLQENVRIAMSARVDRLRGYSVFDRDIEAALEEVGLVERPELAASSLSQGQRKRLELAMVLALRPRVLLLDEPTAGMGVGERAAIMEVAMGAVARRGLTMLFTEHDMETVFAHAERVVVMDRGTLVVEGLPAVVRRDPHVQQIYLGSRAEGDRE